MHVTADRADNDIARVQADADLDGNSRRTLDSLCIALDRLLHPERCVTSAHCVVLVGEGGTEQRHDLIAHDLVHGALVAVDGLHHSLQDGIEDRARLLWIAIGEQFHRALEVGEEHGDLLALAFEGALRGEDLLGEVFGGVGLGRAKAVLRSVWSTDRLAALETKLRSRRKLRTALTTPVGEPSPAL